MLDVGPSALVRQSEWSHGTATGQSLVRGDILLRMSDQQSATGASRVTIEFSPSDGRIAEALRKPTYRSYLRRMHAGEVAVGDVWEEFVNSGCGTTRDVTLRIESTTGGGAIDEETELVFKPHSE